MWKYKTLIIITTILLLCRLTSTFRLFFGIYVDTPLYWLLDITGLVCGIWFLFGFIKTLKRCKEANWLTIPFYGLAGCNILFFITFNLITHQIKNPLEYARYLFIVGIPYYVIILVLLVSVFKIKNKSIALYFKMFAITSVIGLLVSIILPYLFGVLADSFSVNWINYLSFINSIFFSLPLIVAFSLFFRLFISEEKFSIGDLVILNADTLNITAGTVGTIIEKRNNGDYYHVEFINEERNLKDTLILTDTDISHMDSLINAST